MNLIRILFIGLSLSACSAQGKSPAIHPALWRVSSQTATIYLFGTVHALPDGVKWHTAALLRAERQADTLVLEINDIEDRAKLAAEFQASALMPNLPEVVDRVPLEKRSALAAIMGRSHIPPAALKQMKTWAVAITLSSELLQSLKYNAANGVEHGLTADFAASHKPIEGLETSAQQIKFFNQFPEETQRHFLVSVADDAPKFNDELNQMIGAWEVGNPRAIAANFDQDMKSEPDLQRVLLHDRNARWADWVVARLAQRGTTLMAVGAGHLAGTDSVISMLRGRGLRVARVG